MPRDHNFKIMIHEIISDGYFLHVADRFYILAYEMFLVHLQAMVHQPRPNIYVINYK